MSSFVCSQTRRLRDNLREGHYGDDDGNDGDARRDRRGDGLEEGRLLKFFTLLKKSFYCFKEFDTAFLLFICLILVLELQNGMFTVANADRWSPEVTVVILTTQNES